MVTNGSLEAGWMLFSTLLAPGDEVVVEQPSYDRTLLMLEKLGVDRIGVPLEADGIDVDGIEQALADGHRPKLVHIIPNFHNPAGCTLSEAKRRRLVELAAEHGFWIFEDDPYREVHFGGRAAADDAGARRGHRRQGGPRLLVLEDGQPRRPGWIPGRPRRRDQGPRQGRGGDLHLTEHARRVDRLRALPLRRPRREHRGRQPGAGHPTRRRRRAARRQIPEAKFVVPGGGYFLWLDLDEGTDTREMLAPAKAEGVGFVAGPDFMLEGGENSLRLSFASVPPDDVPEGIARLARALAASR